MNEKILEREKESSGLGHLALVFRSVDTSQPVSHSQSNVAHSAVAATWCTVIEMDTYAGSPPTATNVVTTTIHCGALVLPLWTNSGIPDKDDVIGMPVHLILQEEVSGVVDNMFNDQGPPECWLGGGGGHQGDHHQRLHYHLTILWIWKAVQMVLQKKSKL